VTDLVATVSLERPDDVFLLRQCGRIAAESVGCDEADQVRFATALSEIGREALANGHYTSAHFDVERNGAIAVTFEKFPRAAAYAGRGHGGVDAARRLVGELTVTDDLGTETVSIKISRLPIRGHEPRDTRSLRAKLRKASTPKPLDELRLENRDLVATLESLQSQREELIELNAELEETNTGVMAMYAQLEGELAETNRGVVALYAELDDKTQRLNEANEAKSRFLASVSHELRSPVNSIIGLLQLLLDPEGDVITADQQRQLSLAAGSAKDLLGLVNSLLDLAKAESGRLQPDVSSVDLAELFSDLRGALRPLVRPAVELIVDFPDLPMIETDRTLLTQVLRNLLTNAVKFTESGTIRLSARETAPLEIEIAVADTGIGITSEDQAKVFEEFFQVRGPLQVEHKGTGLGLPYARRVAKALGGDISLESEYGHGSTFRVTVPVRWQAVLTSEVSPNGRRLAVPKDSAPLPTLQIKTALVVDDEERFRTIVRGFLQGVALNVVEASDGKEALEIMRAAAPDIVFMDLRMPNMNGADVMSEMAADPPLREIPVVIVSSAELAVANRPILGKAVALLAKSNITRETLAGAIAKVFSR
jgi:signal transduction histidine kinase